MSAPIQISPAQRSILPEWTRLRWFDGTREVITTPGHHFLDELGGFPTITEMTRTGSATLVLASGALAQVTAERIVFCADVAPLFERAMGQGGGVGNAAVKVGERDGWACRAGEGEGLRGYGAGGVMGRGRRGRRRGAGSVHMRTVWKLTESQGSVNFCSSDIRGNVYLTIRVGRWAMPISGGYGNNVTAKEQRKRWTLPPMRLLVLRDFASRAREERQKYFGTKG